MAVRIGGHAVVGFAGLVAPVALAALAVSSRRASPATCSSRRSRRASALAVVFAPSESSRRLPATTRWRLPTYGLVATGQPRRTRRFRTSPCLLCTRRGESAGDCRISALGTGGFPVRSREARRLSHSEGGLRGDGRPRHRRWAVVAGALLGLARRREVVYLAHNLESGFRTDSGAGDLAAFERDVLSTFSESWMATRADVSGAVQLGGTTSTPATSQTSSTSRGSFPSHRQVRADCCSLPTSPTSPTAKD